MNRTKVKRFNGQHCETTATGTLLNQVGLELSEPMLFGLGQGLSFIYWNSKQMDFPFLGGRVKPDQITHTLSNNLNLVYKPVETSSLKRAWETVQLQIDRGSLVGLKVDSFYLEYFTKPIHFAGHYIAIYDYNEQFAFLVDTKQQGGFVQTSLSSLEKARNAKGPMSSNNLSYTLETAQPTIPIDRAILPAIKRNSLDFLNPPIANLGYKGIAKAAIEIKKSFLESIDVEKDFCTLSMIMEKAGTGGSLFRNIYRDFIKESYDLLGLEILGTAADEYSEIAKKWTTVSELFDLAGKSGDIQYINQASLSLISISEAEKKVMNLLGSLPDEI
jgi:hypothetical protein